MKRIGKALAFAAFAALALSEAACVSGARAKTDGVLGAAAGWDSGPKASIKVPSADVGVGVGVGPGVSVSSVIGAPASDASALSEGECRDGKCFPPAAKTPAATPEADNKAADDALARVSKRLDEMEKASAERAALEKQAQDPSKTSAEVEALRARISELSAAGARSAEEMAALRSEYEAIKNAPKPAAPPEKPPIVERAVGFIGRIAAGQYVEAFTGPDGLIATLLAFLAVRKAKRAVSDSAKKRRQRAEALDRKLGMSPTPPTPPTSPPSG